MDYVVVNVIRFFVASFFYQCADDDVCGGLQLLCHGNALQRVVDLWMDGFVTVVSFVVSCCVYVFILHWSNAVERITMKYK